jgi:adenylate cyclase
MPEPSFASRAIEQSLRLARDVTERNVATYRIVVFAVVVFVTVVLRLAHLSSVWFPTFFFSGALVLSLALRSFVVRYGNRPPLPLIALAADLFFCTGPSLVTYWSLSAAEASTESTFPMYIMGTALTLVLLVNALRNSVALSIAGAALAPTFYLLTMPRIAQFHPAQISVAVLLMLAGLIGAVAARQTLRGLNDFARLELLQRYLPPEAVERVMREDPDSALAPGGRLVTVTLLASDLRGFTAMSEKLAPAEVMAQLNAYHGTMIEVIDRHGGVIDKFIGDGTLVVFGLTGGDRAAAAAAVACAREMVVALAALNDKRVTAGAPPLAMGVGVHTGQVIAGNLGVPGRRLEFTVIGDAVNTVSRLEGQTKTSGCTVIVSAATVDLVGDHGALRELAPVSLRGREEAVRVYGE